MVAGRNEVVAVFKSLANLLKSQKNWAGHNEGFSKTNPFAVRGSMI